MDAIEQKVRLPSNAGPIEHYARAYAYGSPTRIAAVYFRPDRSHDPAFCQEAKRGGVDNGQILLGCALPDGMKQDERRWVTSDEALPQVSDGGCDYIDVEFDLVTATVTRLACHGEA